MKSLKSKVILSAIVLVFALVATIGSTYAWFTTSATVAVEPMELNVQSSESLLLRVYNGETTVSTAAGGLLDADTYKATLSLSDITGATTAGYNALNTWRLTPVTATTLYATTALNGFALKTMAVANNNLGRTYGDATTSNSTTGGFIDLKFWVLSQGTDPENMGLQDLLITADNELAARDAITKAVKVAVFKVAEVNAAGTLIVDEPYITNPVTNAAAGQAATKVYGFDHDYGFVFMPNTTGYDKLHYYYATTNKASNILYLDGSVAYTFVAGSPNTWTSGGNTYKLDASFNLVDNATGDIIQVPVANLSATQVAAQALSSNQITTSFTNSLYYKSTGFSDADAETGDIGTMATATRICVLKANQPTLINVRIYIEGWDAECTNAVMAAVFQISFKFSLNSAAA